MSAYAAFTDCAVAARTEYGPVCPGESFFGSYGVPSVTRCPHCVHVLRAFRVPSTTVSGLRPDSNHCSSVNIL